MLIHKGLMEKTDSFRCGKGGFRKKELCMFSVRLKRRRFRDRSSLFGSRRTRQFFLVMAMTAGTLAFGQSPVAPPPKPGDTSGPATYSSCHVDGPYIALSFDDGPSPVTTTQQTIDAMPATLDALLAKGYKFVTVSELIAMNHPKASPTP
jgi:hypothetical protein